MATEETQEAVAIPLPITIGGLIAPQDRPSVGLAVRLISCVKTPTMPIWIVVVALWLTSFGGGGEAVILKSPVWVDSGKRAEWSKGLRGSLPVIGDGAKGVNVKTTKARMAKNLGDLCELGGGVEPKHKMRVKTTCGCCEGI